MAGHYESDETERRYEENDLDGSERSPFARDRDKVIYCSAFQSLAGKSQVVAANELGRFHTRLTHTLKVAQLGRVLAARLGASDRHATPDPDVVEAACLAHDIGHPPFGHAGEKELCAEMDRLRANDVRSNDGFEGNAQTFRIVVRNATRGGEESPEGGLNLTRATLRAVAKYPWCRGHNPDDEHQNKWSAYSDDEEYLEWALEGRAYNTVPLEEQIMDWSDNVAYACHDMEDFYRSRAIPLDALLGSPRKDGREMELFLDWLGRTRKHYDNDRARRALLKLANFVKVETPYDGTPTTEARLKLSTSNLISYFMNDIEADGDHGDLSHGYGAQLQIDEDLRFECNLLMEFAWCYVIEGRELRSQQVGQRRIVRDLLDWHYEDPGLLPSHLREQNDLLRAACDHIASMSERRAYELHRRLSGENLGNITDIL